MNMEGTPSQPRETAPPVNICTTPLYKALVDGLTKPELLAVNPAYEQADITVPNLNAPTDEQLGTSPILQGIEAISAAITDPVARAVYEQYAWEALERAHDQSL